MEIESAQALKSQKLLDSAELSFLPLQRVTEDDGVLTIFWADNFDRVFLLALLQKVIAKKFHFICYWLQLLLSVCLCSGWEMGVVG